MKKYKLVCKKGEGTFSEVVKAENTETGSHYAIKCMKTAFDSAKQVSNLREIQALKRLTPHPNIINLEEVLYDEPSGRLAMVFELMEQNLYDMISGRRDHLDQELIRKMAYQIFTAILHMHSRGIFHRDIKPENILVDPTGQHIKVADLGSCRSISSSKQPMTEYIATRWYRSPECLLTDGYYGAEMDIWGAGCVLFEITALFPLFPGSDEIDQINRIHKVLGTPSPTVLAKLKAKGSSRINYNFPPQRGIGIKHFISHAPQEEVDLLKETLIYDYNKRINAHEVLESPYFESLHSKKSKDVPVHNPTRIQSTAKVHIAKTDKVPSTQNVQSPKISSSTIRSPSSTKSPQQEKVSSPKHIQSPIAKVLMQEGKKVVLPTTNEIPLVESKKESSPNKSVSPATSSSAVLKTHPSRRVSPTKQEQSVDTKPSDINITHSPSSRSSTDATRKAAILARTRVTNNTFSSSPTSPNSRLNNISGAAANKPRRRVTPSASTTSSPVANVSTNLTSTLARRRRIGPNTVVSSSKPAVNSSTSPTARIPSKTTTTTTTTTSNISSTMARRRVAPSTLSKTKSSDETDRVPALTRRRVAPSTLSKTKSFDETDRVPTLTRRRVAPSTLSKSKSSDDTNTAPALTRRRVAPSTLSKSKSSDETNTAPALTRRRVAPSTLSKSKSSDDTNTAPALTRRRVAPSALSKSKSSDETDSVPALTRRRVAPSALSNSKITKTTVTSRRRVATSTMNKSSNKPSTLTRSHFKSSENKSNLPSNVRRRTLESNLTNQRPTVTSHDRSQHSHILRKSPDSMNSTLPSLDLPSHRRNKYSHVRSSGYGRNHAPKNISAGTMETLTSSKSNSPGMNSMSSQTSQRGVRLPPVPV